MMKSTNFQPDGDCLPASRLLAGLPGRVVLAVAAAASAAAVAPAVAPATSSTQAAAGTGTVSVAPINCPPPNPALTADGVSDC